MSLRGDEEKGKVESREVQARRVPKNLYIARIPKFPWSECYQPTSALVSCHEAPLLHLFSCHLSMEEALNLGRTCRRLYHFYRKFCQNRPSLVLINDSQDTALEFERLFSSASDNNNNQQGKLDSNNNRRQSLLHLNQLNLHTQTATSFDLPLPFTRHLFSSTLPSLTNLEIISPFALPNLPDLCKTLNSCLVNLETLKLYLNSYQWMFDLKESLDTSTPETEADRDFLPSGNYCQLSLPSLRHLTLALKDGHLIYYHEDLERVKSFSPLSIHCRRLSSLHLSTSDALPRLCSLIHQYVLLPRDQLGMGLGGPETGNESDIQIAHHLKGEDVAELLAMLTSVDQRKVAHSLAYMTHLTIEHRFVPPPQYCLLLPFMSRLRSIAFWCGSTGAEASFYYPLMLSALACLPSLQQMTVDFTGFSVHLAQRIWYPFLPVLPLLRRLELRYPFNLGEVRGPTTCQQTDIVEQLRLDHCFPELKSFSCHFFQKAQYSCSSFAEKRALTTGRELVRGLGKLPVSPEKREINFVFENEVHHLLLYNSADNSVSWSQLRAEEKN